MSGVRIDVLNPGKGSVPGEALNDREINERALVLQLRWGNISFLLPSDIGEPTESRLASGHQIMKSEVLLAPHHGSPYSGSLRIPAGGPARDRRHQHGARSPRRCPRAVPADGGRRLRTRTRASAPRRRRYEAVPSKAHDLYCPSGVIVLAVRFKFAVRCHAHHEDHHRRQGGRKDILPGDRKNGYVEGKAGKYWHSVPRDCSHLLEKTELSAFDRRDDGHRREGDVHLRRTAGMNPDDATQATASSCGPTSSIAFTRRKPVKLFTIGPMFRRERPQKGCGLPHVQPAQCGTSRLKDPRVDAEVILMLIDFLRGVRSCRCQLDQFPGCRPAAGLP